MKNICLTLFLLFYSLSYSQNSEKQRISLVSPDRDTLWLLNEDIGHLIAYSWKGYQDTPEQKKPVILLVNSLPLDRYCLTNKRRNGKSRKK
jgi:hypothetical protein